MSANRVLSRDQVAQARQRHAAGESMRSIARSFGVTHKVVARDLARPLAASSPSTRSTSAPSTNTPPRGAQAEREAVLRDLDARAAATLDAGDIDVASFVRLSGERRAIRSELAALEAVRIVDDRPRFDPEAADAVRAKFERLVSRSRDERSAALVAALAGMPPAVVARALAAVGLDPTKTSLAAQVADALDLAPEATHAV